MLQAGLLSLLILTGTSGPLDELVPFAPPWDDVAKGPTDISGTLPAPAGGLGPVLVRDGHLYTGEERLRIFGVNVTAGACFPDHETAGKVAARMAKFGFNGVRFHFLDSTWGAPRLIEYESGDWKNWNEEALDRFDHFAARLRERGIYLDLNLLVGRGFGVGDGVDPAIRALNWKTQHAIGFFHAPHLEAQKQYARRLLAHRNRYTQLTYAEDPAVAVVEINNENGLLHTWLSGELDELPGPFASDLRRQWNEWLAAKYPDTRRLAQAWGARDEPLGEELLSDVRFERGFERWSVEQHDGARVETSVEDGVVTLKVRETGSAGWHVQLNQRGLELEPGVYTASLRAAADRPRKASLQVMQAHDPWQSLGFAASLSLTGEMQPFSFTFLLQRGDENARFNLGDLNQEGATFRFADLSLRQGGRIGLGEEETLERRSLRVPRTADAHTLSFEGRRDWITFLFETERNHWREMRRYLAEELGVLAPVVGTIVATSTPNLMGELDMVDTHAYWQHPRFPNRPWDQSDWFIRNISMVDSPGEATLTHLAFQRVLGKPHMVSEYNHPAPNVHAAEGPLMLAAVAALQDWDALFLYTYAHDEDGIKAGCIPGFFDVGQHPTIMANVPAASLLFRRADVRPARSLVTVPLPAGKEIDSVARAGYAWGVLPLEQLQLDLRVALRHKVALDLEGKAKTPQPEPLDTTDVESDTGELDWRLPRPNGGVFEVRTPRTKVVLGHIDGQTLDLGDDVEVRVEKTLNGFCTFALTLLEGETLTSNPRRALLVVTGHVENTKMGWKNPERSTVGADWGEPPSLVEPVGATLWLPCAAGRAVLYPLDDRGQRGDPHQAKVEDGRSAFQLGPPHATVWYELEFQR
ncbi:MAG: carbohydrate binding domain-containing protein [Planctomycetota bacterium]